MSGIFQVKKYIQYRKENGNKDGLHSPFLYKLYTEVISNKNRYYAFDELDKIRKQLLQNHQIIEVLDLGAGSQKMNHSRKVSEIAKYSIVSKKYGELLFRLLHYFNPENVL